MADRRHGLPRRPVRGGRRARHPGRPPERLRWRNVGPYRGGRVVAVAGVRDQPYVYYFGGTGGGIWKTTDGGIRWSQRVRRPARHGLRGRGGRRGVRPERGLRRDGRGLHPRERLARRRRLPLHGRGPVPGRTWACARPARSGACASTRRTRTSSTWPRSDTRSGATRSAASSGRATAAKSWRKVLFVDDATGAIDIDMDPDQPPRPVRRVLAGGAHALEPGERRAGQRPLQDDGRRRHLEEDRRRGAPQGSLGPRRGHRLARQPEPAVGADRSGGGRGLPQRRRRRHLEAHQQRAAAAPARLVLHARLRRPEERGRGVRPQRRVLPLAGRRPLVHAHPRPAQRQPRPVDRAPTTRGA